MLLHNLSVDSHLGSDKDLPDAFLKGYHPRTNVGSNWPNSFCGEDIWMLPSPKMWWMNPRTQAPKWEFQQAARFGVESVMLWAVISYKRRTNLVHVQWNLTPQTYRDDSLQPFMLNVIDEQREMFLSDNDCPYTARVTMHFLIRNNCNILPWPSNSPDLNPIVPLWIGRT